MSEMRLKPQPALGWSGLAALVEQLCAKLAHDILLAVSYNHQARDGLLTWLCDHSILEVIHRGIGVRHFLLCSWADVASLAATDKECLACLGVSHLLKLCILADDELFQRHSVSNCEVVNLLCHG